MHEDSKNWNGTWFHSCDIAIWGKLLKKVKGKTKSSQTSSFQSHFCDINASSQEAIMSSFTCSFFWMDQPTRAMARRFAGSLSTASTRQAHEADTRRRGRYARAKTALARQQPSSRTKRSSSLCEEEKEKRRLSATILSPQGSGKQPSTPNTHAGLKRLLYTSA